jgi:insulysin
MEHMSEFLYEARLAGLDFSLDFTSKGVQFTISGFNDKFADFADRMVMELLAFQPSQSIFYRIKDVLKRELDGWTTQQPYSHASYYAGLALETLQFEVEELKAALESCTVESAASFLKIALQKSFGTALVTGNVLQDEAVTIISNIERIIAFQSLPDNDRSSRELSILEVSSTSGYLLQHVEPNKNDENSAAIFYFQLPTRDSKSYMYMDILGEIIEQSFYNSLRTKQQLGYIVYSGVSVKQGVRHLVFTVQSSTVSGDELVERIGEFIDTDLISLIDSLTIEQLEDFKEGLISQRLEPDQRLTQQASRFWSEILCKPEDTPLFNRAVIEAEVVRRITLSDLKVFVKEVVLKGGKERRLLISEINSSKSDKKKSISGYSKALQKIDNEIDFLKKCNKM